MMIVGPVNRTISRNIIQKETGKMFLARDLANLKQKFKVERLQKYQEVPEANRELAEVMEVLSEHDKADPDGFYGVMCNDTEEIIGFMIVTSSMVNNFDKFPEVLQFDSTYKKNRLDMPIVCYLVVDGHGKGRVVGYAVLRDEKLASVEAALECIKRVHKKAEREIKTILIDKAMVELVAVEHIFPEVAIHICLFHSAKLLLEHVRYAPADVREEVQQTIEQLMYKSHTRADYEKYYEQLKNLLPDESNEMRRYYDENWNKIADQWTSYGRARTLNFGTRTTNMAESHNAVIGRVLKKTSTLLELISNLLAISNVSTNEQEHLKHVLSCKVPLYKGNDKSLARKLLQGKGTDFVIHLLGKQETYASKLKDEQLMKYSSTVNECRCPFRGNTGLPCKHIMKLRSDTNMPQFGIEDIAPRWLLKYNCDTSSAVGKVKDSLVIKTRNPRNRTEAEKYNSTMRIVKQIATCCSTLPEKVAVEVQRKMELILSCLQNGKDFQVAVTAGETERQEIEQSNQSGESERDQFEDQIEDVDRLTTHDELEASDELVASPMVTSTPTKRCTVIISPSELAAEHLDDLIEPSAPTTSQGCDAQISGQEIQKHITERHHALLQNLEDDDDWSDDFLRQLDEIESTQGSISAKVEEERCQSREKADTRHKTVKVTKVGGFPVVQLAKEKPLLRPATTAVGRPKSDTRWKALTKYKKGYAPAESDPDELHIKLLRQEVLPAQAIEDLLDEESMISDEVIAVYLSILKNAYGQHVQGLHTPAVMKVEDSSLTFNYSDEKPYVQILHSEKREHYVTVVFDGMSFDYFDSMKTTRDQIPEDILIQMGYIAREARDKSVIISKKNIEYQKGSNNCAMYAMAIATEFCATGAVDIQKCFAMPKLRKHTANVIAEGKASIYPKSTQPRNIKNTEKKQVLDLLCICSLPQEYDTCTMQCQGCETWYHPKCINHPLADQDQMKDLTFTDIPNWTCQKCKEKNAMSTTPVRKTAQ
ncbi:uncharacterized protein LOC135944451 [Cloeon dipterum]|uniref:uncharacterized protein LOC135936578 n=1 Tax=Cloeon dipterum TaxID=197152 RepID=UPI0032203739